MALKDKRIIGCTHGFIRKIKINDESVLSCHNGDVAVHPDFRRMGVWSKIREFSSDYRKKIGILLTTNVTGNPFIIKRLAEIRPRFPHTLMNMVRVKDIKAHLEAMPVDKAWLKKLGFYAVKLVNEFKNALKYSSSSETTVHISDLDKFDDRVNDFWKKISVKYGFIVERNKEYLNWRYCDPCAGGFLIRQAEENGEILGYCVLKINKYGNDYPVGFIVDLLSIPDRIDVTEALLKDALFYFDRNDVNIVNFLVVKDHPFVTVFRKVGFMDSRIKFHMFYAIEELSEEIGKVGSLQADKVFFCWGDHDSLPLRTSPE